MLKPWSLHRIAEPGQGEVVPVSAAKPSKIRLPIAVMHEARRGERVIEGFAALRLREEMHDARRFLEGQAAQEEIVDQAEDRGVQPDPERERDDGERG